MSARERFREWRRRRRGLAARAQGEALEREVARVRRAFAAIDWRPGDSPAPDGVPDGVAVRWGLAEDEGAIADLLELNGMPRWVAFEERFVVAEERGRVSAVVRYRTEPKRRLLLGLLVADPWRGERRLAVALYAGAGVLARGLGARELLGRFFLSGVSTPHQSRRITRLVNALRLPGDRALLRSLSGRSLVPSGVALAAGLPGGRLRRVQRLRQARRQP